MEEGGGFSAAWLDVIIGMYITFHWFTIELFNKYMYMKNVNI